MNVAKIAELATKALALVEVIGAAIDAARPAADAVAELMAKVRSGEAVTDEELARVEALLDAQLTDFNRPIDPRPG